MTSQNIFKNMKNKYLYLVKWSSSFFPNHRPVSTAVSFKEKGVCFCILVILKLQYMFLESTSSVTCRKMRLYSKSDILSKRLYHILCFSHCWTSLWMDLLPNNQSFDLNRSRQKFHHSLKEHHKISNIQKFRCEML
jgi:hypothetical protein